VGRSVLSLEKVQLDNAHDSNLVKAENKEGNVARSNPFAFCSEFE
jgi:hypothetical protein